MRVLYANLWLLLCWVLFTLRHEFQNSLDRIGMRGIYVNSVLISLAYVVPLAILPVYVFGKDVQVADDSESVDSAPHKTKDFKLEMDPAQFGSPFLK